MFHPGIQRAPSQRSETPRWAPCAWPMRVRAVSRLLRQVLEHLLCNAHKFSPAGSAVEVRAAREDGLVWLTVRDAGGGLTEAEIERLFEPFYRTAAARVLPGAGLGLTIVKNAVELMGGVVMVESEPGEGTTVTVNIPDLEEVGHGR